MKRLITFIALVSTVVSVATHASGTASAGIRFHNGSTVRFASEGAADSLIGTADAWVHAFGPIDRQMRLGSTEPVGEQEFLDFAVGEVRPWTDQEIAKMTLVIESVRDRLASQNLELDLPDVILLVRTTGHEESDAGGYTRSNAIIIPESVMPQTHAQIEGLFLHELFHVMTRHNPQVRVPLYDVISFKPCQDIDYPPELIKRKITNPDAFHFDSYVDVTVNGAPAQVMPLTLSKTDTYTGGKLFSLVTIEFLEIDPETHAPRYLNGEPVLYAMSDVEGFIEKVGANTGYVIHPEEIMADNFMMAVLGKSDVPNPEILAAVLDILSGDN